MCEVFSILFVLFEKFEICLEYSRMFGSPCVRDVRCALQPMKENLNAYFDPRTFCFFTCIFKTIFHLRCLFFMALLCTSPVQESISDSALLEDFEPSRCTLSLLGVPKLLTETPCRYVRCSFIREFMFLIYLNYCVLKI